jgi:F-box protein 9
VDRAYQREEMIASALQAQVLDPGNVAKPSESYVVNDVETIPSAVKSSGTHIAVSGGLATLVDSFPKASKFDPEIEGEPSVLNMLPDELVVMTLRKLDPTSVERFSCISRKARVLTLESIIWK